MKVGGFSWKRATGPSAATRQTPTASSVPRQGTYRRSPTGRDFARRWAMFVRFASSIRGAM